jgi:hypothetical protein
MNAIIVNIPRLVEAISLIRIDGIFWLRNFPLLFESCFWQIQSLLHNEVTNPNFYVFLSLLQQVPLQFLLDLHHFLSVLGKLDVATLPLREQL